MREIKFKVFIKRLKWLVEVEGIDFESKLIEVDFSNGQGDTSWYGFDEVILFQYTGLKDKSDQEIYLNDIAKREFDIWKTDYDYDGSPLGDELIEEGYFIGVVSQTPSGMYVLNKCRKYDIEGNLLKKCSGVKLFAHRCEVIGNIYENQELLEGVNV